MNKIKFSICIPNYNYGQYLGETIQSVLNQTYQNFEIIVADNASTDNSIEVIKSFNDERIRLISNKYNIGYSRNVDIATSSATGDFMILQLADDMLKPDALEEFSRLIEFYSKDNEDVIVCGQIERIHNGKVIGISGPTGGRIREIIDNHGKTNVVSREPIVEIYFGRYIYKILMITNFTTPGPVQATCFSKSLYDKVNGYNSPTVTIPDASFGHKICLLNPKVIYYSKPLAYFRVHDTSFTAETSKIKNIKLLTDKYLLSLEFSNEQLKSASLSRKDLQHAFIKYWCVNNPFHCLYSGKIEKCYRYFIFGFASYPNLMLQQPKTYAIIGLFWMAPVFWTVGNVYRKFFRKYLFK
ncbi:MAG: glycosyltransferase family 2 protein [Bacteroidetes bacterium]|nr:glycosyltransferase family 2 protein [Bacteroidota bacterium]